MNLKTYKAATMPQALALVKNSLGRDAVILHTRHYKEGGVMGFGARTVVEITAGAAAQVGRKRKPVAPRRRREEIKTNTAHTDASQRHKIATTVAAENTLSSQTAGDLIRKTYAVAQAELDKKESQTQQRKPSSSMDALFASKRPVGKAEKSLEDEVAQIKKLVQQMYRMQASGDNVRAMNVAGGSDELLDQYLALIGQEVAKELAQEVIDKARNGRDAGLLDPETLQTELKNAISHMLPIDTAAGKITETTDGRPRTIALVGPTGVGKTTTIAKLAATFKLKQKKKVGLITMDTYRIAAVDQLRTYAQIIGVDLQVASSSAELTAALQKTRDCDVVLIDTAGRSQKDDPKLGQLSGFLATANPHEVHLVLSSTSSEAVMLDIAERFSQISYDRLIFTKLDEAVSYGVLLNVAKTINKQLSYLTTGQEVPHQIEPTQASRIADLVMGGKL